MTYFPRRTFIKQVLAAMATIAMLNPVRKARAQRGNRYPSWKELVDYARWCPTVHNLQPHRLKIISETEAELYYEPGRLLPIGDPESIFATVALGVFIENLAIAAAAHQIGIEIVKVHGQVTTLASGSTLFASLRMMPNLSGTFPDRELILKRKTSRLHYDGKQLSDDTFAAMKADAALYNQELFSSSEKDFSDFIISLNQQTLFEDISSKADREELDHLFRYTQEDAAKKRDGLWAKCMCFPGKLMQGVFRHHERWEKGLRKDILAGYYKRSFKGTRTICWFTGPFGDTSDWLNAGRALARNWLILTNGKAYLHPFGSLITNKHAYQKLIDRLPAVDAGKKVWLIFRAGYSNEPARSYRLNTEEIIIN